MNAVWLNTLTSNKKFTDTNVVFYKRCSIIKLCVVSLVFWMYENVPKRYMNIMWYSVNCCSRIRYEGGCSNLSSRLRTHISPASWLLESIAFGWWSILAQYHWHRLWTCLSCLEVLIHTDYHYVRLLLNHTVVRCTSTYWIMVDRFFYGFRNTCRIPAIVAC